MNIVIITSCLKGRTAAFEWIASGLRDAGHRVMVLNIDQQRSDFESFMEKIPGVLYQRIQYGGRNKVEMLRAFWAIVRALRSFKAQAVHTHYIDANLLGLSAALVAGVRRRVHTRHTSTQHYRFTPDKFNFNTLFNRLSTHIIAISDVVVGVLRDVENVPGSKIIKVHHGFDFSLFENIQPSRVREVRQRHGIPVGVPVVGAISRFDEWKGVEYIVEAFRLLRRQHPDAFLVLANASGVRYDFIKGLLGELPPESYCEIKYENDVFALLKAFDVFVHVPIDGEIEAYGQVYVEAMAAGVPTVCTISGVAHEYIRDGTNAVVVDYQNPQAIFKGICTVLSNPGLSREMTGKAKEDVRSLFSKETMVARLDSLFTH